MNEGNRAPIFIALAILALVLLRVVFSLDPVSSTFDRLLSPVADKISNVTSGKPPVVGGSASDIELAQLQEENRRLRDELSFAGDLPYETIAADVSRKRVNGPRKYVSVNRGSADGIKAGDPVLAQGVLVGVVSDVDSGSADIQLVIDAQFRATARVVATGIQGVVTTQYGSTSFDLVPRTLSDGSAIETDGADETFPPGLAIGTTGASIGDADSIFNRYVLVLPVNPALLDSVLIIVGERS